MAEQKWSCCKSTWDNSESPPSLRALSAIRSLIVNPHTPVSVLSSILETFVSSLAPAVQLSPYQYQIIKLLVDLAAIHPPFSGVVTNAVSLLPPSLASLSVISSLPGTVPLRIDDSDFLSLCYGKDIRLRLWLLRNAEKFGIRWSFLFTVFLGFTHDPYPRIREAALNGLAWICRTNQFENRTMIEGCYNRSIELLDDPDGSVRRAAVRSISVWGQTVIATCEGEDLKTEWSDAVFMQIGSAVRDMCPSVRTEALDSLGLIRTISDHVLLQSLSKKVLSKNKIKRNEFISDNVFNSLSSSAAGAILHGIEDEFHEVRKVACCSLSKLAVLSAEFAAQALNLLAGMLTDDAISVRSAALEGINHLAKHDILNIKETHMHMLLGTLTDNCYDVRASTFDLLKLVKFSSLYLFRSAVNGLLKSLTMYPNDEADIFRVLYSLSQNHCNLAIKIVEEAFNELDPVSEDNMGLLSVRAPALLLVAISVPLACQMQMIQNVPPHFFSYAVTLLGRISSALKDVMDQNTWLSYLSQCSKSANSGAQQDSSPYVGSNIILTDAQTSHLAHDHVINLLASVLPKVEMKALLFEQGYASEILELLRVCKEQVAVFDSKCNVCSSIYPFVSHHIKMIELLVQISSCGDLFLETILKQLDNRLREIKTRFTGFSEVEEMLFCELMILISILRLSKRSFLDYEKIFKKLQAAISTLDLLQQKGCLKLSVFANEVRKLLDDCQNPDRTVFWLLFNHKRLVSLFCVQSNPLSRSLRHIYVELRIPGNDLENPFPFIPGLPLSIPLEMKLHNVRVSDKLWVTVKACEEVVEFVFMDESVVRSSEERQELLFETAFYGTPKVVSCTLRICVGMECEFEEQNYGCCGGPNCPLVYLSPEIKLHIVASNHSRKHHC